jgi:hypothetical protein
MLKTIAGLQGVTILKKEAQKKITGGSGTCLVQIPGQKIGAYADFSMQEAKDFATRNGVHWCCSSCDTATWVPNVLKSNTLLLD